MRLKIGKTKWIVGLFIAFLLQAWLLPKEPFSNDLNAPPGVTVAYRPASTKIYLGSPSIAILPNGDYVASFQQYGFGAAGKQHTFFYGSSDRGQSWKFLSRADRSMFPRLFVHQEKLYCMATRLPQRNVVLIRSDDGGKSWTQAQDATSGVILSRPGWNLHTTATPVVTHQGRLWAAVGDNDGPRGPAGRNSRIILLSIPKDKDLLNAANWQASEPLASQSSWLSGNRFGGWQDGNAVLTPEGKPAVLARLLETKVGGKAAVVYFDEEGKKGVFDPAKDIISLPGGEKKFSVRYDPESQRYWALTNHFFPQDRLRAGNAGRALNMIALIYSTDLRQWTVKQVLQFTDKIETQGFMDMEWAFDGDDIVALTGTAWRDDKGGAESAYRANYICFHRFEDFRRR